MYSHSGILLLSQNNENIQDKGESENNQSVANSSASSIPLSLEVFEIVSNFSLSKSVVPFLTGRGLSKRSLLLLKSEHLTKIFPDNEIGLQLEFEDELLKWKEIELSQCSTITSEMNTSNWVGNNSLTLSEENVLHNHLAHLQI